MTNVTIEQEITIFWQDLKNTDMPKAERIDVRAETLEMESEANRDALSHLSLYLALIEEAMHFLLNLHKFTMEHREKIVEEPPPSISFLLLLSRACVLTMAIRKLVISGFDDAARPVVRSLLETIDLGMVTLADEKFANDFMGDEMEYDANEFWKKNIAYGKMDARLKEVLIGIGFSEEEQTPFFEERKSARKTLSSDVHSSFSAAFLAMVRPSLARPGLIRMSALGHVSAYSPSLLLLVISEIYRFGSVVLKYLMLSKPPLSFSTKISDGTLQSLLAAFLTYQEMYTRYEDELVLSAELPEELISPVETPEE